MFHYCIDRKWLGLFEAADHPSAIYEPEVFFERLAVHIAFSERFRLFRLWQIHAVENI